MLSEQELRRYLADFSPPSADKYLASYKPILGYFAQLDDDDTERLIVATCLVYSWMPTSLRWNLDSHEQIPISSLRASYVDRSAFELLVSWFDNSVVAASKFAHFLNPETYAIWDRRISSIVGNGRYHYQVNRLKSYWQYRDWIERTAFSQVGSDIQNAICRMIDDSVTAVRAMDLLLFYSQLNRP